MAPVTQNHLRVEVGQAKEGKKGSKGKKPSGFVPLLLFEQRLTRRNRSITP